MWPHLLLDNYNPSEATLLTELTFAGGNDPEQYPVFKYFTQPARYLANDLFTSACCQAERVKWH